MKAEGHEEKGERIRREPNPGDGSRRGDLGGPAWFELYALCVRLNPNGP